MHCIGPGLKCNDEFELACKAFIVAPIDYILIAILIRNMVLTLG